MNLTIFETHSKAIDDIAEHYGIRSQRVKAIEELNELATALAKDANYGDANPRHDTKQRDGVVEEIADVLVMVSQLISLYDCEDVVEEIAQYKIYRQLERIAEEENT